MASPDKKIPLVEMFGPTIQGEGAVIGQQTYFMRFGLCDYKCTMCDSMNAVDPAQVKANARYLTQIEIADEFSAKNWLPHSTKWITLSGGNPCIHDLTTLVSTLKAWGHKFAVETQGTFCPDWLSMTDLITVSPKGPGMGEKTNIQVLDDFMYTCKKLDMMDKVNFKIVIFDQRDIEFAKMLYERYRNTNIPFYLSLGNAYPPGHQNVYDLENAVASTLEMPDQEEIHKVHMSELSGAYRQLFEDIKCDPILSQMRFLPQWHVYVWGNQKGK